jgi:formylglycine-generating enzyme required for sulfatase activity
VLQSHSTMQSGPETQEITESTNQPTRPQTAAPPQSLPPTQPVTPASYLAATEKVSPPSPPWHAPTVTAPIPQRPDPIPRPPAVTGEVPRRKPVALIAVIAIVVIGLGIAALLFFMRGGSGMTLTLKNAPPGAQVFINDANRGSIGPDGTLKIAGINPGQATVRLVHDKFSDFTTTVSGNKGDEKAIEALMLPTEIDYNGPMVLIPAGQFLMGNNSGPDDEKPAHNVTLPAYYIDKYEVTNEQYKRFCDAERGGKYPETTIGPNYVTQNPKLPIVAISYDDAVEFAKWDGKRLPNEAEWEKAASWDPKTQQKRKYPWGEAENAGSANIGRNEVAHLSSGGTNASDVSAYGVFDMGGNVGEWIDGMYTPYDGNRTANANYGNQRLVRGASMHSKIDEARTTFRGSLPVEIPGDRLKAMLIGIRCAISADDPRLLEYLRSRIKP